MPLEFEWDHEKAKTNRKKHGVTFEEAATVFADPLALTIPDPDHSEDEDRYITVGESTQRRIVVVSAVDRNDIIRIISARIANRRERRQYEEAS